MASSTGRRSDACSEGRICGLCAVDARVRQVIARGRAAAQWSADCPRGLVTLPPPDRAPLRMSGWDWGEQVARLPGWLLAAGRWATMTVTMTAPGGADACGCSARRRRLNRLGRAAREWCGRARRTCWSEAENAR